jgi:hypothetical protein
MSGKRRKADRFISTVCPRRRRQPFSYRHFCLLLRVPVRMLIAMRDITVPQCLMTLKPFLRYLVGTGAMARCHEFEYRQSNARVPAAQKNALVRIRTCEGTCVVFIF